MVIGKYEIKKNWKEERENNNNKFHISPNVDERRISLRWTFSRLCLFCTILKTPDRIADKKFNRNQNNSHNCLVIP